MTGIRLKEGSKFRFGRSYRSDQHYSYSTGPWFRVAETRTRQRNSARVCARDNNGKTAACCRYLSSKRSPTRTVENIAAGSAFRKQICERGKYWLTRRRDGTPHGNISSTVAARRWYSPFITVNVVQSKLIILTGFTRDARARAKPRKNHRAAFYGR